MTNFDKYINKLPFLIVTKLKHTMQDPKWHPEGNVFNHTKLVFDAVIANYPKDDALKLTAIFHDLGKIDNTFTKVKNGVSKIVAYGHEFKSLDYIDKYFHLFSDDTELKNKVTSIVKNHMRAHQYSSGVLKNKAKRDAFEALPNFKYIMEFSKCDDMGKNFKN